MDGWLRFRLLGPGRCRSPGANWSAGAPATPAAASSIRFRTVDVPGVAGTQVSSRLSAAGRAHHPAGPLIRAWCSKHPFTRTARLARPRPGQHEQQPAGRHDSLDHRPGQVRQEKAQLNGGTRA
jgi:hypothetical protein